MIWYCQKFYFPQIFFFPPPDVFFPISKPFDYFPPTGGGKCRTIYRPDYTSQKNEGLHACRRELSSVLISDNLQELLFPWFSSYFKQMWRAMIHHTCEVELVLGKNEWGRVIKNKLTIHRPYFLLFSIMKLNLKWKRLELKRFCPPNYFQDFNPHRKRIHVQKRSDFGSNSYFAL